MKYPQELGHLPTPGCVSISFRASVLLLEHLQNKKNAGPNDFRTTTVQHIIDVYVLGGIPLDHILAQSSHILGLSNWTRESLEIFRTAMMHFSWIARGGHRKPLHFSISNLGLFPSKLSTNVKNLGFPQKVSALKIVSLFGLSAMFRQTQHHETCLTKPFVRGNDS